MDKFQSVEELVKQILGIKNDMRPDEMITAYNVDSVNILNMIFALESFYNISIKDEDFILDNFLTISKIKNTFQNYLDG